MENKTFEEYKKEAEEYLFHKDSSVDLCSILSGLQKTLSKTTTTTTNFKILRVRWNLEVRKRNNSSIIIFFYHVNF